jgi:hypothetical protein
MRVSVAFCRTCGPQTAIRSAPKGGGVQRPGWWFSWIIDIGFAGPDRGEGGRYLLVPPGYDGPLPDSGFHVARSRTTRVLYAARAFLTDNDQKPTVDLIKKTMRIYPRTPREAMAPASPRRSQARCDSYPIRPFP